MLADYLKYILVAENEAHELKLIVNNKSREALDNAINDGENAIMLAEARAQEELDEMQKISDRKAMEEANELASSTANRLATMRARAERRADMVAERIFERIVGA